MSDSDAFSIPTLTSEFPVVGDDPHIDAPLRATVRRLSTLLGYTLADQHGPELLELEPDPRGDGEVVGREFRGHDVFYRVLLDGVELVSHRPSTEVVPLGARVTVRPHDAPVSVFS